MGQHILPATFLLSEKNVMPLGVLVVIGNLADAILRLALCDAGLRLSE